MTIAGFKYQSALPGSEGNTSVEAEGPAIGNLGGLGGDRPSPACYGSF